MQVMVFETHPVGEEHKKLLVLPVTPSAATPPAMPEEWHYFATVDANDELLAQSSDQVQAAIELQGYCVVEAFA